VAWQTQTGKYNRLWVTGEQLGNNTPARDVQGCSEAIAEIRPSAYRVKKIDSDCSEEN